MDIRQYLSAPSGSKKSSTAKRAAEEEANQDSGKRKKLVSKSNRRQVMLTDSDDDFIEQPKRTTRATAAVAKAALNAPPKTKAAVTDPSAYFGSVKKTASLDPIKAKATRKRALPEDDTNPDIIDDHSSLTQDLDFDDDFALDDGDNDNHKLPAKNAAMQLEVVVPQTTPAKPKTEMVVVSDEDDDQSFDIGTAASNRRGATAKKGAATKSPAKVVKTPTKTEAKTPTKTQVKSAPSKADAAEEEGDDKEDAEAKRKARFRALMQRSGPTALGSKEVPTGRPNCLNGLAFVQTGELSSIARASVEELIKRYGGRVTSAVSGKTSYLIKGADAGETKTKKAEQLNVPIIDEDQFFDLIRTRPGQSDDDIMQEEIDKERKRGSKGAAKLAALEEQVKAKKDLERQQERELEEARTEGSRPVDTQLWTDKYAPTQLSHLIGNPGAVETLSKWLVNWTKSRKTNFKFTGEKETTHFRAALISGPPGIGKTTAAHLVSKLQGYEVLEFNASDTRSKNSLKDAIQELTGNRTIGEFYGADSGKDADLVKKQVIVMDEVDGMSAGDRGGLAELVLLIRKTKVPIICICNDRTSPKMKTLDGICLPLRFRRPDAKQIQSRMMTMCFREGLKLKQEAIHSLVATTQSDIRQIINILSTYRLQATSLDFDEAKQLGRASEKDMSLGLFDLAAKMFEGGTFLRTPMAQKIEYYFADYELMPLMMQENYLNARPNSVNVSSLPKDIALLDCMSKAADAIATGSILDKSIRSGQNWGLLPAHAVHSTIAPAVHVCGGLGNRLNFPSSLGNMSKASKGNRLLKDISVHMRLKVSGDRSEIRNTYIPALIPLLSKPLLAPVPDVDFIIGLMDQYYLSREDYDSIFELGVGDANGDVLLKAVPSAVKSKFTREWNKRSHPTPFPVASSGPKRATADKSAPDMEEVLDAEVVEDDAQDKQENDEDDVTKDKLIVLKKSKDTTATKGASKRASSSAGSSSSSSKTSATGKSRGASASGRGRGRGRGRRASKKAADAAFIDNDDS